MVARAVPCVDLYHQRLRIVLRHDQARCVDVCCLAYPVDRVFDRRRAIRDRAGDEVYRPYCHGAVVIVTITVSVSCRDHRHQLNSQAVDTDRRRRLAVYYVERNVHTRLVFATVAYRHRKAVVADRERAADRVVRVRTAQGACRDLTVQYAVCKCIQPYADLQSVRRAGLVYRYRDLYFAVAIYVVIAAELAAFIRHHRIDVVVYLDHLGVFPVTYAGQFRVDRAACPVAVRLR